MSEPAPSAPRSLPYGRVARGRLAPPPSKSVTHRYLNLALLSGRPAVVEHPLLAEDTRLFLGALDRLGWRVEASEEAARLTPPTRPARPVRKAVIDCGNAGTLFRFLTASLTTRPGTWRLDGSSRLRERPVGPLLAALRSLGAEIACPEREGFAPLVIRGGSLRGGRAVVDAGESSQYLSALLMAALRAPEATILEVAALTSGPYVELTRQAIRRFVPPTGSTEPTEPAESTESTESGQMSARAGDPVQGDARRLEVSPCSLAAPAGLRVEADLSAACYPAAAAALTGGRVTLEGVRRDSVQGDRGFLDLLARMGARVTWSEESVEVAGGDLAALEVDLSAMPDQVPTLAALAPFARGTTHIYNVAHLRIKESDRLRAMAEGLDALGFAVRERPDGLVITGRGPGGEGRESGRIAPEGAERRVLDPHGDHRIAMSFALVGLGRPGVAVADPGVVAKSYPAFWQDLESLLGGD